MFRKNATTRPNLLGDRLKAISEARPPEEYAYQQCDLRAQRNTVFKPAIALTAFGEKVPVVIKNISESGARVEFFQNRSLKERLLLSESSLALQCWADVVWEGDNAVGLRFLHGDTSERGTGITPVRAPKTLERK